MRSIAQDCTIDGRLPVCFYELYSGYKKGTRTIIEWLVAHGSAPGASRTWVVTVRDLVQLADNVKMKRVEVPVTVAAILRETIEARAQLSHYFVRRSQNDHPANCSHEYFTASLKGIYEKLCKSRRKTPVNANPVKICEECSIDTSNRYVMLESCVEEISGLERSPCSTNREQELDTASSSYSSKVERRSPRIADDDLGETIEILRCLQEMQDLCSAAKQSWRDVANGSNPLVVAALITNIAFSIVEEIDARLCTILGHSDPEVLFIKYTELLASLSTLPHISDGSSACLGCVFGEALRRPWQILLSFKEKEKRKKDMKGSKKDISKEAQTFEFEWPIDRVVSHDRYDEESDEDQERNSKYERPTDYIVPDDRDWLEKEQVSWIMILRSINQLIDPCNGQDPTDIMRLCSPFVEEIRPFLKAEGIPRGIMCAFGLQILIEGFRGHLWPLGTNPNKINCRVETLRFTQHVISNIQSVLDDATMPCRCPHTLARYLERYATDLVAYTKEKKFNLYTQSPWVAGSHMLEILDMTFFYGLRLCSYRNYMGSVLHVYNVLTKFGHLKSVPLLEQLSEVFLDVIFLGERPSRNFASCLIRFMGGRIRFNTHGRRSHGTQHSCSWDMEIPRAPVYSGRGLRKEISDERFRYDKFSLFHQIKNANYVLDDGLWAQVFGGKKGKQASRKEKVAVRKKLEQNSISLHPLYQVEQAVLKDFEGDFPVARINLFKAYLACAHIVSRVSDEIHGAKGDHCLCFVETLLRAADQFQESQHALKRFPQQRLLEITEKAFMDELGDQSLSEFLWQF